MMMMLKIMVNSLLNGLFWLRPGIVARLHDAQYFLHTRLPFLHLRQRRLLEILTALLSERLLELILRPARLHHGVDFIIDDEQLIDAKPAFEIQLFAEITEHGIAL